MRPLTVMFNGEALPVATREQWRMMPMQPSAHAQLEALLDRCEAAESALAVAVAERDAAMKVADIAQYFGETAAKQAAAALDQRDAALAQVRRLRDALKVVLMFHGGGPWDAQKQNLWYCATGHEDATTKVMCDHIRVEISRALAEVSE